MENVAAFFHNLVIHFGYLGLFVAVVLGNLGIPVGVEVLIPTAGALAGAGHFQTLDPIPAWVVVGLVGTLAELTGGAILYAIGWYGGLPFVHRYGKYVRFREHELDRVHAFYERYGKATVFWCRFIPFVRGLAALPPGLSRMPKRYFFAYTALGSGIFCFALAALGDEAGRNVDAIAGMIHEFGLAILAVVVVAGGTLAVVWRRRRSKVRAEGGRTRQGHPMREPSEDLR
jgi:membrane protein DedA with SNARE-associated domain